MIGVVDAFTVEMQLPPLEVTEQDGIVGYLTSHEAYALVSVRMASAPSKPPPQAISGYAPGKSKNNSSVIQIRKAFSNLLGELEQFGNSELKTPEAGNQMTCSCRVAMQFVMLSRFAYYQNSMVLQIRSCEGCLLIG